MCEKVGALECPVYYFSVQRGSEDSGCAMDEIVSAPDAEILDLGQEMKTFLHCYILSAIGQDCLPKPYLTILTACG